MKLRDIFTKILSEGGNVSSRSPGWAGVPGEQKAQEIDLKIHDRDFMVEKIRNLLHAQNESFKSKYGRYIWNPKIIDSNEMFSGSSLHFFDVKGISTQDFLNKLKKDKVGDIDTQVDQEIGDEITAWLKSAIGKKVGNGTFIGFNASLSSIWLLDDPPVRIQIDYELGLYDPKTKKPTQWFAYSHSADYNDMVAGIKGVFHKYINRALPYAKTSTKYVARVLKKSTKISPEPVTDSDYSFAVTGGGIGGGLAAKYKIYIDPQTGKPMEKDGIPVMQELPTDQKEYVQNLDLQFQTIYGKKPTAQDRTLQKSFIGTIQLMNKYLDDAQKEEVVKRFFDILFGKGAQMITANDPVRDRDIKFAAIDAMLLGGDGITPLKIANATELRKQAVSMALEYEKAFEAKAKKPISEAGEAPNYRRQGIQHLYSRLPDGRVSSMEMKDAEFIELCKEIANNGGTLDNIPVTLKVDGAGIRFGKDQSGQPFFMTSKVTTPLYKKDVGYFTRFGQEQGQSEEQLNRTRKYDDALNVIVNSNFIQTLPDDTIVQAEMLYNPMAEKIDGQLKFVNIPYDAKKLGKEMTLVPFTARQYSTGTPRPDQNKIIQNLISASSPSIKIVGNKLQQEGIDVSKIIDPVVNMDPKLISALGKRGANPQKEQAKAILDQARQQLSSAIVDNPKLKGKDILGNNMEGIVVNMPSGRTFKVTSQKMKAAMAAKASQQSFGDKTVRTAVVAIGNFAGHRGHEALINFAINKAAELKGTPFVFVGSKVGPDDPIDVPTKLETLHKLFPNVNISPVSNQVGATGDSTAGSALKKVEYELVKKAPFYNNIIIAVGSDQAQNMSKWANSLQNRFSKYPPLAHVKLSVASIARDTDKGGNGLSTTQLRNALKTMPEDQALAVWSQAYNVQKLGVDWVKHLMDIAKKNMGLKSPKQPIKKAKEVMAPPSGPEIPATGHLSLESTATKQRLDPKCWKGYKKAGTKVKSQGKGKPKVRVNKCIKVGESWEQAITAMVSLLESKSQGSNISATAAEIAKIQKKKNIQPGTDEWFKLWFSLPYLNGKKNK